MSNVVPEEVSVGDIRRRLVYDEDMAGIVPDLPSTWQEAEKERVRFRRATQHSDLHGENILVGPGNSPMLIDYARVGTMPAPFDPVALELSFVFHPAATGLLQGWPDTEEARKWCDLDAYLEKSPLADAIRQCREWALDLTAPVSDLAIWACAYVYLVWIMGFPGIDRASASSIAAATIEKLLDKS
jgi:hypothetical protein